MSATGNEYPTLAQLKEYGEALKTGNVLTGTATGYAAHADDAYAAKPREVRIEGRTVKNLWVNPSGTNNGITVTENDDGSVTVSGTATATTHFYRSAYVLKPSTQYTLSVDKTLPSGVIVYIERADDAGYLQIPGEGKNITFTTKAGLVDCIFGFSVVSGSAVDASFRVMLVEGTEAPDCFVPTGLHSVQAGDLVTAGKNLLARMGPSLPYTTAGITFSDNGDSGIRVSGTATVAAYYNLFNITPLKAPHVTPGTYVASLVGGIKNSLNLSVGYFNDEIGSDYTPWLASNVTGVSNTGSIDRPVYIRAFISVRSGLTVNTVVYPQLELGSTATAYEPPAATTTPLPEVELRSLPNGTCDELVIGADGTCEVERRTQLVDGEVTALPEPTTEPQTPVTLPALPAPTFNQYHDSQVPSDTSVEYERDVNIAYAELEAKIAALTANVTAATAAGTAQLTVSELAAAKTNSKNIVTA